MTVDVVILNYNGRTLLGECLPSVVAAAQACRRPTTVWVVDNASTDDSLDVLRRDFPSVRVRSEPNLGLCSFNSMLADATSRAAVLLNNDIRLAEDALDPLVEPFFTPRRADDRPLWMTAAQCLQFDGAAYEGQKTAIGWRWGLIQATSLFPGHEAVTDVPDATASAGAAIAVDRERFLELGGFDPIYLPGRLEDLDLAYRAYLAGFEAWYVPDSVAYHLGAATFKREFGDAGCARLALRNTLVFQWRNLRRPAHWLRQAFGLGVRLAYETAAAPWKRPENRWTLAKAALDAWRLVRAAEPRSAQPNDAQSEGEYFVRYAPQRLGRPAGKAAA
ncbi:MAG TPA: glycosyltransferase [Pirellulales bacterium]